VGNKIYFDGGLVAEVIDNTTSRGRTIRFLFDGSDEELYQKIEEVGHMPLPPYIKREDEPEDRERYQTIFAQETGSVAAPTAGLHFTPELVERLKQKGVDVVPITLHVGLGTFRPIEVEDLTKHRMDSEYFTITEEAAERINRALLSPEHTVTAVGTTVVRALESSISATGTVKPGFGWTDKFIYPPYDFKIVERLITNFHMPRSTLLALVVAFAGYDFVMEAYRTAVQENTGCFPSGMPC